MIEYEPFVWWGNSEEDEPICVCPEYFGTTEVTWCKACMAYTDDLELIAIEAAEKKPAAHAVYSHVALEVA